MKTVTTAIRAAVATMVQEVQMETTTATIALATIALAMALAMERMTTVVVAIAARSSELSSDDADGGYGIPILGGLPMYSECPTQ